MRPPIALLALLALALLPTQAALAEEGLPDGRVTEMVTPASNQDADVYVPYALSGPVNQTLFPFQVAPDGGAVTYVADATTGGEGETGKALGDQYLARRGAAGGWVQSSIQPAGHRRTQFQGFSGDLATGVLVSGNEGEPLVAPLTRNAPGSGYAVLYTRNDFGEAQVEEELLQPFFTNEVAFNRKAGEFGVSREVEDEKRRGQFPVFAGATSNYEELFFEANDDLTLPGDPLRAGLDTRVKGEIAAGENNNFLYRSVGGVSSLVSVLPDGEVARDASFGGPPVEYPEVNPPDFSGAVSPDGDFVYWTDVSTHIVYVSVGGVSVQVSAGAAQYWTSAEDGRLAFYVEGGQLFRYNEVSRLREALTGVGSGVQGVIGASDDGQSVYVVASGVLPGAGASGEGVLPVEEAGLENLYLLHDGSAPVFIATLSEADDHEAEPMASTAFGHGGHFEFGDWQAGLGHRTAGVVGDGGGVVFMSGRGLPAVGFPGGYPGGGADEVYMFEAGVDRLFCVSCSSSGEPLRGGGAAAFLPVSWNDVHLPEWVVDGGNRVFFDSAVSLVAQDTNGRQDVYEWEREGTGGCTPATAVNGGCIYLLSGGTSEDESWFIGSSESGDDVFVASRAQLAPEDHNDAFNLFDARVGGVQPVTAPACTGTGCQGVPESAPTFATPSSVTFNGPGNFPPPAEAKPAVKPKPKSKGKKAMRCRAGFVKRHGRCTKRAKNSNTKGRR